MNARHASWPAPYSYDGAWFRLPQNMLHALYVLAQMRGDVGITPIVVKMVESQMNREMNRDAFVEHVA